MAADKKPERLPLVELVASVRGFYAGSMVHPGQAFMFDPNPSVEGGKVKWPKWAAPKGEEAQKKPAVLGAGFDTRPPAAVKAAKAKAGAIGGG